MCLNLNNISVYGILCTSSSRHTQLKSNHVVSENLAPDSRPSSCKVSGCDSEIRCKNLCEKHYAAARRCSGAQCSAPDCTENSTATSSYCNKHRLRLKNYNSLSLAPREFSECSYPGCKRVSVRKGQCNKHNQRYEKYGDAGFVKFKRGIQIKWLRAAVKRVTGDCIIYPFCVSAKGYGTITYNKESWSAHRLAYFLVHGAITQGLEICHNCGVRDCVNPAHLRQDTHQSNIDDTILHGTRGKALTESDVDIVQSLLPAMTNREIAEFLNDKVTAGSIYAIRNGKSWSHHTGIERSASL